MTRILKIIDHFIEQEQEIKTDDTVRLLKDLKKIIEYPEKEVYPIDRKHLDCEGGLFCDQCVRIMNRNDLRENKNL